MGRQVLEQLGPHRAQLVHESRWQQVRPEHPEPIRREADDFRAGFVNKLEQLGNGHSSSSSSPDVSVGTMVEDVSANRRG